MFFLVLYILFHTQPLVLLHVLQQSFSFSGDTSFEVDSILRIKDGQNDEWFKVIDASDAPTYIVVRDFSNSYNIENILQITDNALIMQKREGCIYLKTAKGIIKNVYNNLV